MNLCALILTIGVYILKSIKKIYKKLIKNSVKIEVKFSGVLLASAILPPSSSYKGHS